MCQTPVTNDVITMQPVLDAGGELNKEGEYFLSNNALYHAKNHDMAITGLRAYFTSTSPLPIRARVVFDDNSATSIDMIEAPAGAQVRKIMKDGKLIIIRGEQQ